MILQVGAGTGLLYLVRWFWWRVNAWCEVVAMVSSFAVSIGCSSCCGRRASAVSTHAALLITVAITTICWVATAYLGPQTDRDGADRLLSQGPSGRARLGARPRARGRPRGASAGPAGDNIPMALLGWVAGCTAIWSALFAEGNYLYGRMPQAIGLGVVFLVSSVVLAAVVRRGYADMEP